MITLNIAIERRETPDAYAQYPIDPNIVGSAWQDI